MESCTPSFTSAPCGPAPHGARSGLPLLDDQGLLLRSREDDRAAFDLLFERHRDELQGFLYRKLRSHEEAEDAVALTFCNAWRARATFRGEASGKTWLYRIASRVAVDMTRRRRRRALETEWDDRQAELVASPGGEPGSELLRAECAAEVQGRLDQAIGRLAPEARRLLSLYYFEGYNYQQISSELGISYGKVRGRLHLIRERLRRDLLPRAGASPATPASLRGT